MKRSIRLALLVAGFTCSVALAQDGALPGSGNPAGTDQPSAATPGTTLASPSTSTRSTYRSDTLNSSASGRSTDGFIKDVSQANSAEMTDSQYAIANSQNPQVRTFAQKMLADHGKAERELKDIAARKGITVPTDISLQQKQVADQLEQKKGPAFDAAYAKAMTADHERAVALFKKAAQNPQIDSDVRKYAQQLLPTLQDHLTMANRLRDVDTQTSH